MKTDNINKRNIKKPKQRQRQTEANIQIIQKQTNAETWLTKTVLKIDQAEIMDN